MRQNNNSSRDFTDENYSATSAPVWTIGHASLSNYFDISTVPNSAVLHYNQVVRYIEPSRAKIERKNEGILSLDSLIDKDPDQLWLYFMTYLNEKPCLLIHIHGSHTEYYQTYENYPYSNNQSSLRNVVRSRRVIDFSYYFDLSPYISQEWWRIAVIPLKKKIDNGEIISLRNAIEQYTYSKKRIKEIICQKQLFGWNFKELKDKIKELVSSNGYQNNIRIDFSLDNHQIIARSSSKLSRFSNSIWTRILCFLSCFCLIFGPIYLCLRSVGSIHDQIVADYNMISSTDTFLQMNAKVIVNAALSRSRKRYLAKIA